VQSSASFNIRRVYELQGLWNGPVATERRYYSLAAPDWFLGMTDEFRKGISAVDRKLQGRIPEALSYITKTPVSPKGDTVKPLSGGPPCPQNRESSGFGV
jgi:hypothetical protein